jgi:hypothetical protein
MVFDGGESEFLTAVYLISEAGFQRLDSHFRRGGMGYTAWKIRAISSKTFRQTLISRLDNCGSFHLRNFKGDLIKIFYLSPICGGTFDLNDQPASVRGRAGFAIRNTLQRISA